jgi:hypothetical protein
MNNNRFTQMHRIAGRRATALASSAGGRTAEALTRSRRPRRPPVRKLLPLAVAASIAVLTAPTAAQASTTAGPSATLSFAQQTVASSAKSQLRYATRNLPSGSHVDLQVEYGAVQQWTSVEILHGTAGTATLPELPAGLYRFRIRVLHGITTVAVSAGHFLTVTQASSSSGCSICALFGGIGGAVASWFLQNAVPWLVSLLPW